MAIQIQSQVIEAVKVYRLTVRLTSITPIPDPVAYVSDPEVWLDILAIAGLPELLFVAAVLVDQGSVGEEKFYDLEMTFDHTHVTATGHSHDNRTLFFPLREAYRDGPGIDLASNIGPVDIWSSDATIDYLRVREDDGDDYFYIKKDGTLQLGQHVRFLRDGEFDIGSTDGGTTLNRPRDVYISRDLDVGNNVVVSGDVDAQGHGSFGDFVQGTHYLYTPQAANPDTSPTSRHTYWNNIDNTLRGWDGSMEFVINGGGGGADIVIDVTSGEIFSIGDAIYLNTSDGKAYKTDADAPASAVFIGFAKTAATAPDQPHQVYVGGEVVASTDLSAESAGVIVFLDTATPGGITTTAPSGTGDTVLKVGIISDPAADKVTIQVGISGVV
jgi:hypothetical protein